MSDYIDLMTFKKYSLTQLELSENPAELRAIITACYSSLAFCRNRRDYSRLCYEAHVPFVVTGLFSLGM